MVFELWKGGCFPNCDRTLTGDMKGSAVQYIPGNHDIPRASLVISV